MTPLSRSIAASAMRRVEVPYFPTKNRSTVRFAFIPLTAEPTARVCKIFLNGQCHALALALHDLTGWQILGEYTPRWDSGSHHTRHFVIACPNGCTADATGVHCCDAGYRNVKPEMIREWRIRKFLPPALEFAHHFAPMILREINIQLESSRSGKGKPYWPFCWDGSWDRDKQTGKLVKTHA